MEFVRVIVGLLVELGACVSKRGGGAHVFCCGIREEVY